MKNITTNITKKPSRSRKFDLMVCGIRALLGEIRTNMRKISIQYDKQTHTGTLFFYLDTPFNQVDLDYDVTGAILVELEAEFFPEITWKEKVIVIPFPEVINEEGICIFSRYEKYYEQ